VLAGIALIFLEAAATVEVIYTIRPSYALLAAACAFGLPFAFRGWMRLPVTLRWLAVALFAVYVLAAMAGETAVLRAQERGGNERALVYLSDLALGLAVLGLICGLWSGRRSPLPLLIALAIGAAPAAFYAIYQWFAQHYGWPLADVNNAAHAIGAAGAPDASDTGFLGWQRARGTFAEPHFLGAYLAMVLPITLGLLVISGRSGARRLRSPLLALAAAMAVALVLTSSLPAWGTLALGGLAALALFSVAKGMPTRAALAGTGVAVVLALGPLTLVSPQTVAPLTGRDSLEFSTEFRAESWGSAVRVWASRPVLGYGPGQSSIRVAGETTVAARAAPTKQPRQLGSAQGLWAAALVDAGSVGAALWLVFLGSVLFFGGTRLLRDPTFWMLAIFSAALTAVLGSQLAGDRLPLSVWVMMGVLLSAAVAAANGGSSEPDAGQRGQQPDGGSS